VFASVVFASGADAISRSAAFHTMSFDVAAMRQTLMHETLSNVTLPPVPLVRNPIHVAVAVAANVVLNDAVRVASSNCVPFDAVPIETDTDGVVCAVRVQSSLYWTPTTVAMLCSIHARLAEFVPINWHAPVAAVAVLVPDPTLVQPVRSFVANVPLTISSDTPNDRRPMLNPTRTNMYQPHV
jgi:hypothetical protein